MKEYGVAYMTVGRGVDVLRECGVVISPDRIAEPS